MNIQTKEGIAVGQPLSDIQEYNIRLKQNTKAIYVVGFIFLIILILIFIFLFWYVHTYNVLNNIVARCL